MLMMYGDMKIDIFETYKGRLFYNLISLHLSQNHRSHL